MLEFAWPWLLLLLPLPIPVWWLLPAYRARQASVQVPFFDKLAAATGRDAAARRRRVAAPRRPDDRSGGDLGIARCGAGASAMVGDAVTREVSARDLILAIDISGSMDQRDFKAPDGTMLTRLDGVKRVVRTSSPGAREIASR